MTAKKALLTAVLGLLLGAPIGLYGNDHLNRGFGAAEAPASLIQAPIRGRSLGQTGADEYAIFLKSRTLVPPPGVSPALRERIVPFAGEPPTRFYVITQFWEIPGPEERRALEELDIRLLDYLPNFAWFASLPPNPQLLDQLEDLSFHRASFEIEPGDKLAPGLPAQIGEWARTPDGGLRLIVQPFGDVPLAEARQTVERHGGRISAELPLLHLLEVALPEEHLRALAEEPRIQWIEAVPPPPTPDNDGIRAAIGVDAVQTAPYNLNGEGVVIGEWDGGWADPGHPDLAGRVTIGDPNCAEWNCRIGDHATHVAGTAMGDGTLSEKAGGEPRQWRGMAPKARLVSFEWWNNLKEALREYAVGVQTYSVSLSTNSWGYDHGGYYETGSRLYDELIQGVVGKKVSILGSAGNFGDGGWGLTRVPNSAKNTIVVGATDSATGELCRFSSRGPASDGRLKPGMVAPGCDSMGGGIRSTLPVSDCPFCEPYGEFEGTSMATPAAAGAAALVLQQYRLTFSRDPLPSTLKALLLHTAKDLGPEGPDFAYGYGQIDVKAAVDLIRDHPENVVEDTIVDPDEEKVYSISVDPGTALLKVTLVWDDAPAAPNVAKALVDDLDLEVIGPDGSVYYPWVLDPTDPGWPATVGPDHMNNVEQVLVNGPAPGEWVVRVKAFRLPSLSNVMLSDQASATEERFFSVIITEEGS